MLHSIHGRSRTALALLVNGGHAPHIRRVTPSKYRQADASPHHAAAIARWEEEGGAATSLASVKIDQALAEEERILEYFRRGRDHAMGALYQPKSSANSSHTLLPSPISGRWSC